MSTAEPLSALIAVLAVAAAFIGAAQADFQRLEADYDDRPANVRIATEEVRCMRDTSDGHIVCDCGLVEVSGGAERLL